MRFWGAWVLAFICVGGWLPSSAHARRVVYAVTIGNNQPPANDQTLAPLRYADDDAVRYFELFSRASDNVQLLTVLDATSQRRHAALTRFTSAPTLENLERTLARFTTAMDADRKRGDQPVLLLTYSGHGSTDAQGRYFLSFLDGELTQELLYDRVLAGLANVEVHLIVDACNAGGIVGMRGGFDREAEGQVEPLTASEQTWVTKSQSLTRFPFVGALVATSSGQEAHEWSQIEAGVFTHEVISALLGGADVNGDLRIEYSEVQAFVAAANRAVSDPRAVPQLLAHAPSAIPHAVLLDLSELRDTLLLTGTATQFGRFALRMPDGRRIGDAHLTGSGRLALALPQRRGMFVEKDNLEAEIPTGRRVVQLAQLRFRSADEAVRGPIERSLRQELFASPYTRDYYIGFVDSSGLPTVDLSATPPALLGTDQTAVASAGAAQGPARDDTRPTGKWLPIGLLVGSGVALVTAGIAGGLALAAKSDFDDTNKQREAHDLRNRYQTYAAISGIAAAVSGTTGVMAWLTWPSDGSQAGASAGVRVRGRF